MKRTNTFITITSFILTAALLLTGCTSENGVGNAEETTTTITATQPMIDTVVTTAAIETTVEETTTTTTTTTAATTIEATTAAETTTTEQAVTTPVTENEPAPEWTEQAINKTTMYVNTNGIYSRKEAVMGSAKVKQYTLNSAVTVVASTDTSYYKLEDGAFIHKDYLSNQKVTVSTAAASTAAQTQPQTQTGNSKQEQARAHAKEIADFIRAEAGEEKSLKQIGYATYCVNNAYRYCEYSQSDPDDWTAYGIFFLDKGSCQGVSDALRMVLEELGYECKHVNKNLYEHQWVDVYFDYSVEVITNGIYQYYSVDELAEKKADISPEDVVTVSGNVVHADAYPWPGYMIIGGEYGSENSYPIDCGSLYSVDACGMYITNHAKFDTRPLRYE